jgi:hypothetical protein
MGPEVTRLPRLSMATSWPVPGHLPGRVHEPAQGVVMVHVAALVVQEEAGSPRGWPKVKVLPSWTCRVGRG